MKKNNENIKKKENKKNNTDDINGQHQHYLCITKRRWEMVVKEFINT